MMKKTVKDGQVAVLYSPGYGSGWSTWNSEFPELVFDSGLVDLLLSDYDTEVIETYCKLKYPDAYLGGVENLTVTWVPEGTQFIIDDYDGDEFIMFKDKTNWITA